MPGTETKGFDAVIEFAEKAYADLLGVLFDDDGLLFEALNSIPGVNLSPESFTVDVLLDRPSDAGLRTSDQDPIDIRISIGESGSAGSLRVVVGIDVDRTAASWDIVQINFKQKIYFVSLSIGGISIPSSLAKPKLEQVLPNVPLMPVPIERTSSDPTTMTRADFKVIDDTSSSDLDATAIALTFGGGTTGTLGSFTKSFVPPGGRGAIAIWFNWLCRVISPAINDALDAGAGVFTNCTLNRTIRVDEEEEVDLTQLELSIDDGFIRVKAKVKKSGTCYEATGTITAKLKIAVEDGNLVVESEVGDPDVDIDIPWYCWVAAAVIGAALGGILLGVIGAIVGGILVPLIMWLMTEKVEGTIESVAERVTDAINDVSPNVEFPAFGINIIFEKVTIDDISIRCQVDPVSHAPVRSSGYLVVYNNQAVDLDNGQVGTMSLPGTDLIWKGEGYGRTLTTGCNSALARTDLSSFKTLTRYALYKYHYSVPAVIPLLEIAVPDPFGIFSGDYYRETGGMFAVRTNEQRYAAIRVEKVTNEYIRLYYRTYQKYLPSLQIVGEFSCEQVFVAPKSLPGEFIPSQITETTSSRALTREKEQDEWRSRPSQRFSTANTFQQNQLQHKRIGIWRGTASTKRREVGRFSALANGFKPPLTYGWSIDGQTLTEASGTLLVKGVSVGYEANAGELKIVVQQDKELDFELQAKVVDSALASLSVLRCIHVQPTCTQSVRVIPNWKTYQAAYRKHFGIVEVPRIEYSATR